MRTSHSIFYQGADGTRLHMRHSGARSGWARPCVVVHGYGMHARVWDPLSERLAYRTEVAALDLRGHGDSCWCRPTQYALSTLVDDAAAAIDALAWEEVDLVGHSLGARVALHVTGLLPWRVRRLTLVDYAPDYQSRGLQALRSAVREEPEAFDDFRSYIEWLGRLHPLASASQLVSYARSGVRQRADGRWQSKTDPAFRKALWSGEGRYSGAGTRSAAPEWSLLQRASMPVLVVRGAVSALVSAEQAERVVSCVGPEAELVTVAGAGHALPLDQPDACAAVIEAFLDR